MRLQKLQKNLERDVESTKNRKSLEIELMTILEEKLTTNDKVLIEVQDRDLADFIDILNDKLATIYDFDQYSKDKFIFYNKEISL